MGLFMCGMLCVLCVFVGTRLGRQSNSVKRSPLIEYQKRQGLDVALFPKLEEEKSRATEAVAKVTH